MRILAAVVVWGAAVAAALGVSAAVASGIHSTTTTTTAAAAPTPSATPSTPNPPTPPAPFDPSSVKPTDPRSLFVGSNFHRILQVAQRHLGANANIETARVAPGSVELTAAKGNKQTAAIIYANGEYLATPAGPLSGPVQVFYLSQLSANVPRTLAKRIATLAHVPTSHLQYMLVATDPAAHQFFWRVYPGTGGVYFQSSGATGPIQELGGVRTLTFR